MDYTTTAKPVGSFPIPSLIPRLPRPPGKGVSGVLNEFYCHRLEDKILKYEYVLFNIKLTDHLIVIAILQKG